MPALTDWRGVPIIVGAKVIYHRNHSGLATWMIGTVAVIRHDANSWPSRHVVDVQWEESTDQLTGKLGRGLNPKHLTVWPKESYYGD